MPVTKTIDYSQLKYDREIRVKNERVASYPIELDIDIRGLCSDVPDCKVGHFGYNFWFRTNAGINKRKYTSRKRLELAVENLLKRRGFEVLGWV